MLNNPVNLNDPSGHVCVNGSGNDDVAMAGNCGGAPNPNYDGGLLGPEWNNNSGSTSSGNGVSSSSDSTSNGIVSLLPEEPACTVNTCFQDAPTNPFGDWPGAVDPSEWIPIYTYGYDSSRVDGIEMIVDIGGIITDIGAYATGGVSTKVGVAFIAAGLYVDYIGLAHMVSKATRGESKITDLGVAGTLQIIKGSDWITKIRVGRAAPMVGITFNAVSIVHNLAGGFYIQPISQNK